MKKKCIYLSTCDTCRKIMKAANLSADFELHDLKKNPIDPDDLDFLIGKVDHISELVNKRSRRIKQLNLDIDALGEAELRKYLQEEYTFVKRPIFIIGEQTFIGNSKKTVASLLEFLS